MKTQWIEWNPDGTTLNLACRDMRQFEFLTLSCMSSYIHTRFYNRRKITGARFEVVNTPLCFLKSRIVNRCQVIRNTETCEIFQKPRYLARCVSVYYPVILVYMLDCIFFLTKSRNLES